MNQAPESLTTTTVQFQPVPAPANPADANFELPQMICDIAEGSPFVEEYRKPHIPVMSAFGGGQLHSCRLYGSWNLDPMMADHGGALFRSIRKLPSLNAKEPKKEWEEHGVSEAIYLRDPDDNGLELYWDRPPTQWPRTPDQKIAMFTRALDLDSLLKEIAA